MTDIKIDTNLLTSTMLPQGLIERWRVADGTKVRAGEAVSAVRIEDVLHDISAPIDGRLLISALANQIVEPGTVVGEVNPQQFTDPS